jgi:uracil-DNA glycosylase
MEAFKTSLKGVHPQWVVLMKRLEIIRPAFQAFSDASDAGAIEPPENLVFEAFKYFAPLETGVIVLGQDPYPDDAQGLCFSIGRLEKPKPSLRAVLANLQQHGHARTTYRGSPKKHPPMACGDLRTWALQRVLLLNTALTTQKGKTKAHVAQWKPFTRGLLKGLTRALAENKTPAVCILWGRAAEAFAPDLHPDTRILTWTHPSPQGDNRLPPERKFANHTHFADANAHLADLGRPPVLWDPLRRTVVFTDGACKGNGTPKARASYAVTFVHGPLRGVSIGGMVLPYEYVFADTEHPIKGFVPTCVRAKPSNVRGEFLAGCWALLTLLRARPPGRIELVTDYKGFLQTLEEWLPKRRREGTAAEMKNFDLVQIAEVLLARLRSTFKACTSTPASP